MLFSRAPDIKENIQNGSCSAAVSGLFKKETGTLLTHYIQHRRVEEAKHFIKYSSSQLSEIANFYQFCSQSHFIKVFKQHTGITPCEYRK